jgi:hypothetical protein
MALALASACAATPADRSVPVFGRWEIAGASAQGAGAPSPDIAAWIGTRVEYSRPRATLGDTTCEGPTYEVSLIGRQELEFRFGAAASRADLAGEPYTVVAVRCPTEWRGPGADLIVQGTRRLVAPWNGAFYDLQRND